MSISIVIATTNRVDLLRQCIENVVGRTSDQTREVIVWDNASTDGTAEYLAGVDDERLRVVHHPENLTTNAYELGFRMTSGAYLVGLDDDVIDAPPEWDRRLLEAYKALPDVGYLAANLADNEHDVTSQKMYGRDASLYESADVNGVRLKLGPVGAWCAMTSRDVYDRVGGYPLERKRRFFYHDEAYIGKIRTIGLRTAILEDLEVIHAGGSYYAPIPELKRDYWRRRDRRAARRTVVKRLILAVPFAHAVNRRLQLFEPPKKF